VRTSSVAAISLSFAAIGGALALASAKSVPAPRASPGLWTVTISSSHGGSQTEQVCLNDLRSAAEVLTCAGPIKAPNPLTSDTVTCKMPIGPSTLETTTSVVTSDDQLTTRVRTEEKSDFPGVSGWSESTITYRRACPVPLKPEQPFVVIKSNGAVVDPFEHTPCMVAALKTVDGVTDPSVGWLRDPRLGPRPIVRYRYPGRNDEQVVVTFVADGDLADPERWEFIAEMSGLHSGDGPYFYGADKVMQLWKERCGVETNVLFQ